MMKGRPRAPFEELKSIGLKLNTDPAILKRAADLVVAYLRAEPKWTPRAPVMAAATLYMSTVMWGRPMAQTTAAEAIGVSASTINRAYKKMAKTLFPYSGQCCQRKGQRLRGPTLTRQQTPANAAASVGTRRFGGNSAIAGDGTAL